METRAHHLLIGSFMLAFLVAIVAFVLWLAKSEVDREVARYNIFFNGSVAGLGVGGDVRFNGIKVGSVSQILIDRENTSRVRVVAEVDADTPIRADSEATLQLQGITGVSFVQITPGSRESPILPVVAGRDLSKYPTIRSKASAIEALFEAAPDLITRAAQVLSDENLQNLGGFIADLRALSQTLVSRQDAIAGAVDSFSKTSTDIAKAASAAQDIASKLDRVMNEAEATLKTTNRLLEGDATAAAQDARKAMAQLNEVLAGVSGIIEENRAPLNTMTTDGFGEFRRLMSETRILVASLARVAQRLEDNPSSVLFGNRDAEYRNEGGGPRR
ncbi:MlaD family protein [Ferrovibrio terrae]|uniref:MlaD family protein n=1 Tax=Ferrovibrio terrae TaxID=2594003 RepID=UPI0031380174